MAISLNKLHTTSMGRNTQYYENSNNNTSFILKTDVIQLRSILYEDLVSKQRFLVQIQIRLLTFS